jgi:nucleotide-binding universal stress UspA family protein
MADIIVGYDGGDCAKAALELADSAAKAFGDRIVLTWVMESRPLGGEAHDLDEALKEMGERVTGEGADTARAAGVDVEVMLLRSDNPASGISELAAERNARMIVVGTHGESPLKGAIIGSTPHKLVQVANTPVLVVPANS